MHPANASAQRAQRTMPKWNKTTARVLTRLRDMSLPTVQWQPTAQEKAAIERVWAFVGVRLEEYKKNWDFVGAGLPKLEKLALRAGVRERLLTVFDEAAFSEDADEANGALGSFQRQHLLDWGDRLLAAEAANDATAANLATEAPPPPPPPPSAAEAAAASVANESSDEDSTDTDTAISHTIASLPEDTRSTVVAIMEGAAAEGYELSDWDELVHYARSRYVEAAGEFGAVDAARDKVLAPAVPDDALFDDDLSELYENVSRSRSGRDGASVISDFSLSSRLSGLSFVSQREALRRLHRDMIDNRVSVDTIPGLKKTRSKLQKAARKIRKAGTRGAKKVQSFFTGKR